MVILHFPLTSLTTICLCFLLWTTSVTSANVYRSFDTHIQTSTSQVYSGTPAGSLVTYNNYFQITFITAKSDTNYGCVLAAESLSISYEATSRYSNILLKTGSFTTYMEVDIYSSVHLQVQSVMFRYLVIDSTLSAYLHVFHSQRSYAGLALNNTLGVYFQTLAISPVSLSCKVLTFMAGIDVGINSAYNFHTKIYAKIQTTTQLGIYLYDTSTQTVTYNYIYLDILLIDQQTLQTNQGGLFPWGYATVSSQASPFSYLTYNSSIKTNITFFGISNYSMDYTVGSSMIFAFSISGTNLLLQIPGLQSADLFFIIFEMYAPCTGLTYWNRTICLCVTCAVGTYLDTNTSSCLSCPPNCQNCSNSTICSICNTTYYWYASNSSCVSPCPNGTYPDTYSCSACNIANCQTCSNATTCTNCTSAYYWNNTTCSSCIPNCQTCATNSTCTICLTPYFWYATNSSCVTPCPTGTYASNYSCTACSLSNCAACSNATTCINCTSAYYWNNTDCSSCIPNCQTCATNSTCTICLTPYFWYATNSSCVTPCPAGTYASNYSCVACSLSHCAVCSNATTCTNCTNDYYFLNESSCSLCSSIADCQTCSNATTCTNCTAAYFWNGNACLQCMSNCLNCSNSVACSACALPFNLSLSASCVCPTAMYNNTASTCTNCSGSLSNCAVCSNATVCSSCVSPFVLSNTSICVCPVGQYNLTASSCANCTISNCQACSGQTVCTVCIAPYFNSSGSCALDCSSLSYCSACTYDYSVPTHICTVCNDSNFSVSSLSKRCQPICGNGFVVFGNEACDDGNTDSYDGCSNTCTIEPYFNCTNISNQTSNCTLSSLSMNPLFNMKSSKSNEFTMSYSLEPSFLPIYSRVLWNQAFTVNSFNGTVSLVTYDSAQNRLLVTVQYSQDIEGSDLRLSVSPALIGNSFSTIVPSTVSCTSSTENNLKLDFYESNAYALAAAVQALSIVTAIVSLLLFVAGYFGAKLIALECVATVQLSSLLLFTLQKVNPTFHALHFLGISLGRTYSQSAYSYQPQSMTPQFKGQTVSYFSAVDYGLSILTVLIPLIVGAVLYALLQTSLRKRMPSTDMWNFAVGEYTFYGLAFCSYSAFATLAIDVRFCDNSSVCFIGIATSAFLGLAIIGYCVYFTEHPYFMGQFKKRFEMMNVCQHFYNFAMIERMANAFLIVFLTQVSLQAVGPLIVLSIELSFIIYRRPYVLRGWIRPSFVKSLMIVIILLFLAAKVAPNLIALYIPLLILGCLLICEIYSCVALVEELKQAWQLYKEEEGKELKKYSFEESQEIQLREFEFKMIPDFDLSKTVMNPIQKPRTNIGWKWKQYDKPYSISANMLRDLIERSVKTKGKIFQDQQPADEQSSEI